MSTASSTDGSNSVVATGLVCPPPSRPLHDDRVGAPAGPPCGHASPRRLDGITTTPASLSRAISSGLGASANDATFTPSRTSNSARLLASPASARMLMPNGLVRRCLDFGDRGLQFLQRHRRRREDAQPAGVGGRRHQPRTRHPAHPGLHHRVLDADQLVSGVRMRLIPVLPCPAATSDR